MTAKIPTNKLQPNNYLIIKKTGMINVKLFPNMVYDVKYQNLWGQLNRFRIQITLVECTFGISVNFPGTYDNATK